MPEDEPKGNPSRRPGIDPALMDAVGGIVGKLWKRGLGEAEKAARKGRDRLVLRQLRSDRDRMYQKLGKEARHLFEGGELDHPGIGRGVDRIRDLEAKIQEAEDGLRAVGLDPTDPEEAGSGEAV